MHNYSDKLFGSLENSSVLVTGGAGFIGSNIVETLTKLNVKFIRIMDNLETGYMTNIQPFLDLPNVEFMHADIRNLDDCKRACEGIDMICHQAALGSVPRSINNPLDSHNTNVNGFFHILLAAKEAGIKRVVYASSSSVYGSNNKSIKIEEENEAVLSPYAATKAIDEIYGHIFTLTFGLECIGLRYFNVFGPRQNPNGAYAAVIPLFTNNFINRVQSTINGDGSFSRDFTYIDNVVQANLRALTTSNSAAYGHVFNVGTCNNITIKEMYYKIKSIYYFATGHMGDNPIYGPVRNGDVPFSRASLQKIESVLNYKPLIYFDEGLEKTVKYFIIRAKELDVAQTTPTDVTTTETTDST
jgi:UDP-N-acetylglucosamine/UDP-N-acetylgalactosamine 4-epimerase